MMRILLTAERRKTWDSVSLSPRWPRNAGRDPLLSSPGWTVDTADVNSINVYKEMKRRIAVTL